MSIKREMECIFRYFYNAYAERWHEQGLTGKSRLTVNFFKGGVSSANFEDKETKKLSELREIVGPTK